MHIWVPLLWTQRTLKVMSGGHLNFSREQGSTKLIIDYGAQRARYIRPRRIGTVRARNQIQSINATMLSSTGH